MNNKSLFIKDIRISDDRKLLHVLARHVLLCTPAAYIRPAMCCCVPLLHTSARPRAVVYPCCIHQPATCCCVSLLHTSAGQVQLCTPAAYISRPRAVVYPKTSPRTAACPPLSVMLMSV